MDDTIPGLSQKTRAPGVCQVAGPEPSPSPLCQGHHPALRTHPSHPIPSFPKHLPPSQPPGGGVCEASIPPRPTLAFLPRYLKMGFKLLPLTEPLRCGGPWRPDFAGGETETGVGAGDSRLVADQWPCRRQRPSLSAAQHGPHGSVLLEKGTGSRAIPESPLQDPQRGDGAGWVRAPGDGRL